MKSQFDIALAEEKTSYIFGFCLEYVFSKPEQAKFERQLNPIFQSCFVLSRQCLKLDELLSGLKAAFGI